MDPNLSLLDINGSLLLLLWVGCPFQPYSLRIATHTHNGVLIGYIHVIHSAELNKRCIQTRKSSPTGSVNIARYRGSATGSKLGSLEDYRDISGK